MLTDSLKAKYAIIVVVTPSKLRSNDAVDPVVFCKLNIKTIGAMTPPDNIAPINQKLSSLLNRASLPDDGKYMLCITLYNDRPKPLPRYNNEASKTGGISPTNNLARGALAPNKAAANIA